MLVGVAKPDVAGSKCLVAAWSHGESTGVGWTKTGLMTGPVIPDVVVVNMCLAGDNGAVVEVEVVGGCRLLVLGVVSSLAAVGGLWGPSNIAWGLMALLVACASPHASPSSSNSGCWDLRT